jgi:hypothetical protein
MIWIGYVGWLKIFSYLHDVPEAAHLQVDVT